jgi:hypothetical protein
MEKKPKYLFVLLIFVIVGWSLYFLYRYYPQMHPLSQNDFRLSRNEIIQMAVQYLPIEINLEDLKSEAKYIIKRESYFIQRTIGAEVDRESLEQFFRYWEIAFIPKDQNNFSLTFPDQENPPPEEPSENIYKIRLSRSGQLLLFDFQKPFLETLIDSFSVIDRPGEPRGPRIGLIARNQVMDFLLNHVKDTTKLELVNRSIESDSSVRYFNFTFKEIRADFPIYYTVKNARGKIFYYQCSIYTGKFDKKLTGFEEISEIGFKVFELIVFLFLIISLLIFLFKLLRQEAISFKLSLPLVLIIFVIQFIINLTELPTTSIGLVMLGSVVSATFYGAGILFLYSIGDALARQIWSAKLRVTGLFHQAIFFRTATGQAVLWGIFLGCISLMTFSLLLYVYQHFFGGEIVIKNDLVYSTTNMFPTLMVTLTLLVNSVFHETFYRLFGLSLLKKWFKKNIWIVLIGIFLGLFFTSDLDILNLPIKILLLIPSSLIFVYFFMRFEIFTTVIGYFTFGMLSKAIIYSQTKAIYFQELGISLHLVLLVLLILGVISLFFRRSDDEGEEVYVPAYVEKQTEKTRLLRELDLARSIQLQFLPKNTPKIDHFQIAASCQPAWEVGGDYYDFFNIKDGKLGIVIGDVSNKGISAAFFMTLVKGFLKALSEQYQTPWDILRQTNKLFYENVDRGHFISMIYGILDYQKDTFTFARAGHNPLLMVIGQGNQAEWKTPPGLGIGLIANQKFDSILVEEKIKIDKGDLVILYTDGYPDARDSKMQEFGEENLLRIIRKNRQESAINIIKKLETAIADWEGKQRAMDDKTIIILKHL